MEISYRQQAVLDAWENTDSNILVEAVAGSGKTTLLLKILERCRHRTAFLAFNKSIQEEIQGLLDTRNLQQGKALTMHSMGLSAIRASKNFKINNRKNFDMVKVLQDRNRQMFSRLTWEKKVALSFTLMDFNDVSRIFLTDDIEQIEGHMTNMDKAYVNMPILDELWQQMLVLREEYHDDNILQVDFNDMIFIPVQKELEIPLYCTYLMIDEAQDLGYCQHILVDRLLGQGHIQRWIAVGDSRQSIYGFSGSYASSFQRFRDKENTVEFPLDICYRCPVSIVDAANQVYNIMQGSKTEQGVVETITDPDLIKEGSMVICRNSAPLLELYFTLLAQGKKAHLKGEDIIPMTKKFLKPYTYRTVGTARRKLVEELIDLEAKKDDSDSDRIRYYWFKSQYENTRILMNHLSNPGDKVEDLFNKLDTLMTDLGNNTIMLCTIHKSKGLEQDVVYILNEHLIPSKFAISRQQLEQERNLKYVARTRAKQELYFLNLT